jgi:hypothetical protein
MSNFLKNIFPKTISKKEATDTGMAMALICLLLGHFTKHDFYYMLAIPVLVLDMTFPMFYYPFAIVWLGLTNLLGSVISRVLISVVYLLILFPIGVIRRLMGKDSLNLNGFKKDTKSVMVTRNYQFTSKDIINPF